MSKYEEYSGRNLVDYVINSSNKRLILQDNNFKDYLLQDNNHYAFVWLVQELSFETEDYQESYSTNGGNYFAM